MRARRTLVVVLLVVAVVGAIRYERDRASGGGADSSDAQAVERTAMPVAAPATALGSTWYCAGGTASVDGIADHTVIVSNLGENPVQGQISVYPEGGEPVAEPVEVEAGGVATLRLGDVVEAPFAAALVEIEAGDVTVEHQVIGTTGADVSPCASAPSDRWYFPFGTTARDATEILALFNPFPEDVVLDITVATEEGARNPQAFESLLVPGGSLLTIDLGVEVTRRERAAVALQARNGRLVVDRLLSFDGEEGRRGLAVTLGAPQPTESWFFAEGFHDELVGERFAIFNPSQAQAEVDLEIRPDDVEVVGEIEPFQITIPPEDVVVVDVSAEERVPAGTPYSAAVRSLNGVDVVAERIVVGDSASGAGGIAVTLGAPLLSTRTGLPFGSAGAGISETVAVFNPSVDTIARVTVLQIADGGVRPLPGVDELELGPGGRAVVVLDDTGLEGDIALIVDSNEPVVTQRLLVFTEQAGLSAANSIPISGSLAPAPAPLF